MSVTVKYFASLRELAGASETTVDAVAGTTVADLWQRLHPDRALPGNALAAVNLERVALSHPVRDGDEVAFFPPVTGG